MLVSPEPTEYVVVVTLWLYESKLSSPINRVKPKTSTPILCRHQKTKKIKGRTTSPTICFHKNAVSVLATVQTKMTAEIVEMIRGI